MFERIVILQDGSALGELALPYAAEIAAAFGSDVHLLHICETKSPEHRRQHQAYIEKMVDLMAAQIRAQRVAEATPVSVKAVFLDGEPTTQIIEYAEKNNAGLLILVSHGHSGLMPWSMGSTAARVLDRTDKPVLFIQARKPVPQTGTGSQFSRILVPLDGSINGEAALPYLKELVTRIPSELTLFRVVESRYPVHTIGGLNYVVLPQQEVQRVSAQAKQYLEQVSARLKGTKATLKLEMRTGEAAQEIIKFAAENNISLVAMSSHGHSSIDRWTFGSVTHKVLHSGRTPLFLVRARFG
jgi:nucleotide-binding universal stress UspA family protein